MARPGRTAGTLIVLVLLLAIGLVGVDRIVHGYAEKRVASELESGLDLAESPDVSINGFPFLTQLARSTYSDVEITADELAVRDGTEDRVLTLSSVHANLTDVKASNRYATLVAGRVDGTAAASWEEISRVIGAEARFGGTDGQGRGRVQLTYRTRMLGRELTAEISGRPELTDGELTFTEVDLDVAGIQVPQQVADELVSQLMSPIPLELPLGLQAQELRVDDSGAAVKITGEDVPLTER